jgi:hypothetical protein
MPRFNILKSFPLRVRPWERHRRDDTKSVDNLERIPSSHSVGSQGSSHDKVDESSRSQYDGRNIYRLPQQFEGKVDQDTPGVIDTLLL